MTTLHRLVVSWSGQPVVGSAVNVLHWDGSDNAAPPVAAVKAAYDALKGIFPLNVTVTIPTSGDTIDDTTGELTGVWSAAGGGAVTGTGTSVCAAGVGACVGWLTGGIINGRKLRGRTFIVPIHNSAFDNDGTLAAGTFTALQVFAESMRAAGPLAVWHRPTSKTATDGNSYGVVATKVRDKVAYLSSRRD